MLNRLLLSALLLGCFFTRTALAQVWTQLPGPEGGLVSDISIDSSGTVLIGTFFGGAFESTDHGASWHARNEGLTNFHLRGKGLSASSDGYIYAVSDVGGAFRLSRQPGSIWQRLDTTLNFGALMSIRSTPSGYVLLVTGDHGILRSIDHGTTWTDGNNGLDYTGSNRIDFVTSVPGYTIALTHTNKLYASTDEGASWTLAATTPGRISSINLTNAKVIYLGGTTGAIYRSSDNGASWDTVYQDPQYYDIWSIFSNPRSNDLFAWIHSGHLIHSTNSGDNWQTLDSITSGGDFYPTAIDPSGLLFAGSDFDGMFRSTDNGRTLDTINNGLNSNLCINACVNPSGDVFAMTERYIFRSTDRGLHWAQIFSMTEADGPIPNPMLCDSLGYLYVGTDVGVWRSKDNGNLWQQVFRSNDSEQTVDCRALALTPTGTIYLGSRLGLFQTVNQGLNWREMNGPWNESPDKEVKTVVMGNNGRLYWSDYGGQLYWSDDDVFTYHQRGIQGGGIEAVNSDGIMYSANNADVVMSSDSGVTWTVLKPAEGITTHRVFSVMLDHNENVIISTDSGIYRIDRDNPSFLWRAVSDGLSTASQARWSAITRTVEDVRHDQVFYAAGRGQGMFRSRPNMGVVLTTSASATLPLQQNFPNPFSAATTIRFNLKVSGATSLEVYDATGERVAVQDLGVLGVGEYQTTFSGEQMTSGTYRYLIRTGTDAQSGVMTIIH